MAAEGQENELHAEQVLNVHVPVLVMNLPFRVRWQDLKDLCRQHCQIQRADVALDVDGRSRGFGEVLCSSRADAEVLCRELDGYAWQERQLSVTIRSDHRPGASSLSGTEDVYLGGTAPQPSQHALQVTDTRVTTNDKLLFIGNLPFSMQWQDLKDFLRPAGRIQRTDISMASNGRSRGWGTALFQSAEEARGAIDMFNEVELQGRRIKVRLDQLGGRGVPANAEIYGRARAQQANPYPLQQQQRTHTASLSSLSQAPADASPVNTTFFRP